jgi:hypothetical protein
MDIKPESGTQSQRSISGVNIDKTMKDLNITAFVDKRNS